MFHNPMHQHSPRGPQISSVNAPGASTGAQAAHNRPKGCSRLGTRVHTGCSAPEAPLAPHLGHHFATQSRPREKAVPRVGAAQGRLRHGCASPAPPLAATINRMVALRTRGVGEHSRLQLSLPPNHPQRNTTHSHRLRGEAKKNHQFLLCLEQRDHTAWCTDGDAELLLSSLRSGHAAPLGASDASFTPSSPHVKTRQEASAPLPPLSQGFSPPCPAWGRLSPPAGGSGGL